MFAHPKKIATGLIYFIKEIIEEMMNEMMSYRRISYLVNSYIYMF